MLAASSLLIFPESRHSGGIILPEALESISCDPL